MVNEPELKFILSALSCHPETFQLTWLALRLTVVPVKSIEPPLNLRALPVRLNVPLLKVVFAADSVTEFAALKSMS